MQPHDLSTLPTGERVITEHVPSVRSVSFGFWIGTGSRDETNARAGVSHFIEHLLFKGTSTHSAQEIAEIFDGLGGELNAATSRETTLVYARVPDDRLEPALDVMAGMVYDPAFAEIDSEREVVLEEIAMVDDNPQDLVHDLVAEAVFGGHPIGRPVIGRAEVISSVSKKALTAYHRAAYAADNIVVAAAGNVTHDRVVELLSARLPATRAARPRPEAVRARAAARLPLPAQGDRAVPRLPRRARDLAPRRAPLRRLAARLDPRRLRLVPALPGDPREARHGVLRLQLRLAVLRLRADRPLRRHARGEPRRVLRDRGARARGRRRRERQARGARARAGEPEGPDAALARVDLEPDEPAREVADHRHGAALARRARREGRCGHRPTTSRRSPADLLRLDRLSAAGIGPSESRFRAAIERVNPALVERAAA